MIRPTFALLVLVCATTQAFAADAPRFAAGQEWTIRNSPIHIVIGRVEPMGKMTVVHVSVFHIPCPPEARCRMIDAAHMPFDAETLVNSVVAVVGTNASVSGQFESGYQQWKAAQGGAFTISVPEAASIIFRTAPPGHLR